MVERDPSQRFFVTGIGAVTPLGHNIEDTVNGLKNGQSAIRSADGPGDILAGNRERGWPSLLADVKDFDIGTHLRNLRFSEDEIVKVIGTDKRPNEANHRSALLFLAAGAGALRMAKVLTGDSLRVSEEQGRTFGVISATGVGGSLEVEGGVKQKLGRIPSIDIDEFGRRLKDKNPDWGDRLINHILARTEVGQAEALAEALQQVPDLGEVIYELVVEQAPEIEAQVRQNLGLPTKDKRSQDGIYNLLPGRVDEVAAILFGAKVINDTQAAECAAGLSALFIASLVMRSGYAGMMLAGGTESALSTITADYFRGIKAVTRTGDQRVAGIPFGHYDALEKEVGFVMGDGAAALNIETLEHLRQRVRNGARVEALAELVGFGTSSDAHHVSFPGRYGQSEAIRSALRDAGLEAGELKNLVIPAHATATGPADAAEIRSIADVFLPRQVLGVYSIKGFIGHLLGGAGAVNAAAGIWASRQNIILPNRPNIGLDAEGNLVEVPLLPGRMIEDLGGDFPDPELWRPKLHTCFQVVEHIGHVVILGFGFGGKNRVVIADINMNAINRELELLAA